MVKNCKTCNKKFNKNDRASFCSVFCYQAYKNTYVGETPAQAMRRRRLEKLSTFRKLKKKT